MSAVGEKREIFAHAFIANMAGGMSRNKAAITAAEAAGYRGKFIETNANRLLRHPRVKERIAELVAPAQQAREHATIATVEMAQQKLSEIILANISLDAVKPADRIAAVRQLAAIMGWNAPTHINVNKHVSTDWSTDELVAFIADARNRMRLLLLPPQRR
jgi:hypothetical protein